MGFLFDSIRLLLASEPEDKRRALAQMVGRALAVTPIRLEHPALPGDAAFDVWHAPKAPARPFAVTYTVGLCDDQQQELVALTLADAGAAGEHRFAGLLAEVALADVRSGAVVPLSEGLMGRSSHTRALVAPAPWPLGEVEAYARILGAPPRLVVPVTEREADWIAERGADAYVSAMQAQAVDPWADRAPGETVLA